MRMSESLLCLGARDVVLIALADHLGGILSGVEGGAT